MRSRSTWGKYRDIPWSKWVLKAHARQERDLRRAETDPDFSYYYSEKEAQRAVDFFTDYLKHSKGEWAGRPFHPSDWQEWDIIRPLFGWLRKDNDQRRFRKVIIIIPRKNGKSTLIAGIGLYLFIADCEPGAEVYCSATKEKQAKIVFSEAKRMVKRSGRLRQLVRCLSRELIFEDLDSFMTVLGRDSDTEDGLNVHGGIVDEYHAHPDDSTLEILNTGTGSRRQPLIAITSTAGFNQASPCKTEIEYGKRILDGTIEDDETLVFLTEPDYITDPDESKRDGDGWTEEDEIIRANPNVGISVRLEYLLKKRDEAVRRPDKRNGFKVKHLNIWTSSYSAWVPVSALDASDREVDWSDFEGQSGYGGFDMGRAQDLAAFALAFWGGDHSIEADDGQLIMPPICAHLTYWLPEEQDLYQKQRDDEAQYLDWVERGLLRLTPGPTTNTQFVLNDLIKLSHRFNIEKIGGDIYQAHDLFQSLEETGIEVQAIPQTAMKLGFGLKGIEKAILNRRLWTNKNPILRWNFANIIVYTDGNLNQKIMKDKSKYKVDGMVALGMAVGELLKAPALPVVPRKGGIFVG